MAKLTNADLLVIDKFQLIFLCGGKTIKFEKFSVGKY